MYNDNDTMNLSSGVGEDMLLRMLEESDIPMPRASSDGNSHGHTWGLYEYPLASVYAPLQEFRSIFDKDTALKKGTIFSELDLPFMGETVRGGGSCRG